MNDILSKKQSPTFINILFIILLTWYGFFSQLKFISSAVNIHFFFIVCVIFVLFIEFSTKPSQYLKVPKDCKTSYLFLYYFILNSIFSPYKLEALKWIVMLITVYIIRSILKKNPNISVPLIKCFWISSSIHVSFILLQLIFPSLVNSICLLILNIPYATTLEMIEQGIVIKGINAQSAPAGLFATLFVGFIFSSLIINKKTNRIKYIILLILGLLSIILTLKRSFIISAIFGLYFLFYVINRDKRREKFIKAICFSFVLFLLFIIAVKSLPHMQEMIARTMRVGNPLSGREHMYLHMWTVFKENPIFGVGSGYATNVYSYGSHNVYLQLLGEGGIIGLVLFVFAFGGEFFRNVKISIPLLSDNSKDLLVKWRILTSLYMQFVFFLYCLSGNPLYDYTFLVLFIVFFTVPELEIKRITDDKPVSSC